MLSSRRCTAGCLGEVGVGSFAEEHKRLAALPEALVPCNALALSEHRAWA